jgi:hypothetical protein
MITRGALVDVFLKHVHPIWYGIIKTVNVLLNVYLLLLVNKIINGISLHANVKDVYVSKNNLYCIKILSVVNLDRKIKAMIVIQANVSVE